jgi:hypothetical protein
MTEMLPPSEDANQPVAPRPRKTAPSAHDWRLRRDAAEAAAAEIKGPQLLAFDSFIRERLTVILVRRAAERAAERGLSSAVQAKLWRARVETRRREFADALELEICKPFSLDNLSRPPVPASWLAGHKHTLCSRSDRDAGFDPDTATWLCDAIGPAAVVVQPHYLSHGEAIHIGAVAIVKYIRAIDIIELPPQLGWLSAQCAPLLWVPAR